MTFSPPPQQPAPKNAGAVSNAASLAWLASLALLGARSMKLGVLMKTPMGEWPVWSFVAIAVAASVVWGAVEWATLRPLIVRVWKVANQMGFAAVLGVLASTLPLLGSIALYAYIKVVAHWLREHPEGLWIYLAGFIVLGGIALLPTYAQAALGGFAFGAARGIPLALGGFAGAAMLGFWIAQRAKPERVRTVVDSDARAGAVRRALIGGGFMRQTGIVTLLRLPPTSPFALTNLILAAAGVRFAPFVVGTIIGMAPRTIAAVIIGAGVQELTRDTLDSAMPRWVWWGGIAVSIAVLAVIMMVAKKALADVLKSHQQADA